MGFYRKFKTILLKIEKYNEKSKLLHNSFEVAIAFKGIHSVLEIISGFLLMLLNPDNLSRMVMWFIKGELVEDPTDVIANYLMKAIQTFSISTQWFGVVYLLSHGVIKIFLVVMLWQRKYWAYPLTIVVFFLFIIYQFYRYAHTHSIWLIALTVLDVILILLTWLEYKRIKNSFNRAAN